MPRHNPDKSTDPTVVEYAVRYLYKGQTPKTPKQAAKLTKAKLHGEQTPSYETLKALSDYLLGEGRFAPKAKEGGA